MVATSGEFLLDAAPSRLDQFLEFARRNPTVIIGSTILLTMAAVALLAPYLTPDPRELNPINRLLPPSSEYWFGTDNLGRSVFDRTVHGTRISLVVGLSVAFLSSVVWSFSCAFRFVFWLASLSGRKAWEPGASSAAELEPAEGVTESP